MLGKLWSADAYVRGSGKFYCAARAELRRRFAGLWLGGGKCSPTVEKAGVSIQEGGSPLTAGLSPMGPLKPPLCPHRQVPG